MGIENYIKYNLSSSERSAMAQFRFGILPLNIETGRFRNQALEERLCTLCEFNEIEDESHFLFKCSLYDELRREWVSHIYTNKTGDCLFVCWFVCLSVRLWTAKPQGLTG